MKTKPKIESSIAGSIERAHKHIRSLSLSLYLLRMFQLWIYRTRWLNFLLLFLSFWRFQFDSVAVVNSVADAAAVFSLVVISYDCLSFGMGHKISVVCCLVTVDVQRQFSPDISIITKTITHTLKRLKRRSMRHWHDNSYSTWIMA